MSARPDVASPTPVVTALAGDAEFSIFEVVGLDGDVLKVCTPFALGVGEEIPLHVEHRGRTTGRVTGHQRLGEREITELELSPEE